ncbi:MAG: tetratricopeptide repeat protein [Anaerolineae bacterium]|nr:tetratricopeptide repeat protein [Anaerolineae bacterium]
MTGTKSFGQWLKQRRKTLDFTREDVARRIGCAAITLYKIEANERRPSKQIAELLADCLNIPVAERPAFVRFARAEIPESDVPFGTPFHPPTNLPVLPTPLIGRSADVAAIRKRLLQPDLRLLTLIGAPGIGKTRLALEVAADLSDEFAEGVFFIALAPITDPALVPSIIANTLNLPDSGPHTPLERLKNFCRDKHILLVLDNVEQILAIAPHLADLVAGCPLLKLLVTSRAPLKIRPERQFPVSPLALPDLAHLPDASTLVHSAAVALFVERAQAVKPDFALTSDNAATVAAICARLDGLPLAIELISARVKLLPLAKLLERLYGRLLLQSDGLYDLEPRHRTLNAAIEWSYQLLTTEEQKLFRRLGVFAGGWTLEAAESLCQGNLNVLEGLASLLDKNLIKHDPRVGNDLRFMLLETIREYALDQLTVSGELATIQHQHTNYFLAMAETPLQPDSPLLTGVQVRSLWDQFELDHDNFRAALTWGRIEATGEMQPRLALALVYFWRARGHITEGEMWLEDALSRDQEAKAAGTLTKTRLRLRAYLLDWLAVFRHFQGDVETTIHEESLAIFEELGDKAGIAEILGDLGMQKLQAGDYEQARKFIEQGLALFRELGNVHNIAHTNFFLGMLNHAQGQTQQAGKIWEECLADYHTVGDPIGTAMTLTGLAKVALEQGNFNQAYTDLVESLNTFLEIGERWQTFATLEVFAYLAEVQDPPAAHRAAHILGAVEGLRAHLNLPRLPDSQRFYDQGYAILCNQLDPADLQSSWAEGRTMTFDQLVAYALEH